MRRGFGLMVVLFLFLLVTTLILLLGANREFGGLVVERHAAQAAAMLEPWLTGLGMGLDPPGTGGRRGEGQDRAPSPPGPPPPSPDLRAAIPDIMQHVLAVGLSDGQGGYSQQVGEPLPPPRELVDRGGILSPQPFGDLVIRASDGTVYYLKMGPAMMRERRLQNESRGNRPDRGVAPPMEGPSPRAGRIPDGQILVLKYDGSDLLAEMWLRQVLIIVLAGFALALLGGLLWLFFRVQGLQESLESQRALARLGTAARTLAHEIRNPLSIIMMQKSLLERELGDRGRSALESIGEEARRIEGRIRWVRQALGQTGGMGEVGDGEGPSGQQENVELGRDPGPWFAALVSGMLAWTGRVRVSGPRKARAMLVAPSLPEESLRSILVNLIENALDAYAVRKETGGMVDLAWSIKGRNLRIIVEDRAGGVPSELRRRIFDPFFSTKPEGSGVGLSLARELAEEAGGRLFHRSPRKGGSAFILDLPLHPASGKAAKPPSAPGAPP